MMSRVYSLLFASFIVSGLAMAMAPNSNQPTFHRHFWSTSDKHHYKLSDDGELAQLVLDEKSGSSHIFPLFFLTCPIYEVPVWKVPYILSYSPPFRSSGVVLQRPLRIFMNLCL